MPRQSPQKERDAMRVVIQEDYRKMCKWAADYIAARIKAHGEDRPFVREYEKISVNKILL